MINFIRYTNIKIKEIIPTGASLGSRAEARLIMRSIPEGASRIKFDFTDVEFASRSFMDELLKQSDDRNLKSPAITGANEQIASIHKKVARDRKANAKRVSTRPEVDTITKDIPSLDF